MKYTEKEIKEIIEECNWEIETFQRFSAKNCPKIMKVVDQLVKLILPVVVRQSGQLKKKDVITFDLYKNKYYTKRGDVYFNKITNSYYSEKELKENYEDY